MVAGQETDSDLIDNAVLCLMENPDQLARLRQYPDLLPSGGSSTVPLAGLMDDARAALRCRNAGRDDTGGGPCPSYIARDPNPHIAFRQGIHFCLGAALSRLETRVALTALPARLKELELVSSQPWEPRTPLQVHGPASLLVRFYPA